MKPKHPDVKVQLVGGDGNAFSILGRVRQAMLAAGIPQEEVAAFVAEASAGDYDELLEVCMEWVTVE